MQFLFAVSSLFLLLACSLPAAAQHHHAMGHDDYSTWASEKIGNCCNNQDCGSLTEDEWRESPDGVEVKIAGQWCPVQRQHFIIRGKSPDWTKAHACVGKTAAYLGMKPCDRLLCFAGTPRF